MTGIQAWMGDKPECALHLKKKKVKKRDGGGGGGAIALDERPNASVGRHKGRICLLPSPACPFSSLDRG